MQPIDSALGLSPFEFSGLEWGIKHKKVREWATEADLGKGIHRPADIMTVAKIPQRILNFQHVRWE